MHIAICDDNVADRKQLERLLGRESDKRKADTGVFYIDSFGQGDKLYSSRMTYDLFFIDVTMSDETGFFLSNKLYKGGVTVPIVLCSSKIDYKEEASKLSELPPNFLFINKPILKAQLSDIIDEALMVKEKREPTIELRDRNGTYYVLQDDIVYAQSDGSYLNVHLRDGRIATMYQDILSFYANIKMFPHFAMLGPRSIVNASHVKSNTPFTVTLNNGYEIKATLPGIGELKKAKKRIDKEISDKESEGRYDY